MYISILSILMLASTALSDPTPGFNVLSIPEAQKSYPILSTLPITWTPSPSSPKISLTLIGGASPSSLNPILSIASGIDASTGTYAWSIPGTISELASYGINLTSDSDPTLFQYSNALHLDGGDTTSASVTTTSSSATTASATTTSSSGSTLTVIQTSTSSIAVVTGIVSGTSTVPESSKTTSAGQSSTSSVAPSATSQASGANVGRAIDSKIALLGGLFVLCVF